MAQAADVALYRVQERALRPKRWKLNTEANARCSVALRTLSAAIREIAALCEMSLIALGGVVESASKAL